PRRLEFLTFPYTTLFRSWLVDGVRDAEPVRPPLVVRESERPGASARRAREERRVDQGILAACSRSAFGPGEQDSFARAPAQASADRKSTRLNSSHVAISY